MWHLTFRQFFFLLSKLKLPFLFDLLVKVALINANASTLWVHESLQAILILLPKGIQPGTLLFQSLGLKRRIDFSV